MQLIILTTTIHCIVHLVFQDNDCIIKDTVWSLVTTFKWGDSTFDFIICIFVCAKTAAIRFLTILSKTDASSISLLTLNDLTENILSSDFLLKENSLWGTLFSGVHYHFPILCKAYVIFSSLKFEEEVEGEDFASALFCLLIFENSE